MGTTVNRATTIEAPRPVPPAKSGAGRAIRHGAPRKRKLEDLSDVRHFFHQNDEPIYFVSATPFNLLGLDEWVHRFRYINYIDCFDGLHPNVFVPEERPHDVFQSLEEIVNYLLEHPQVRDFVARRGPGGKAVFLFFDERTEELCRELGLELCFPSARLRTEIDDKINTTRIGNKARVRSVPNVLASGVDSYRKLRAVSGKLGDDLVVQTAFGDSGHTTFFIKSQKDWKRCQDEIVGQGEIKVMKRVDVFGTALEACITRSGTIVGPLMTELVGFPELTPYRGGWCGNEVVAEAFPRKIRRQAQQQTVRLGEALGELGYRGYFEVDWLIDRSNGALYLGEINPRVTGASSMTNLAAFAHADAPLFLFHLLEFSGVDYELDVDAINRRWSDPAYMDTWSQMVIKHTRDTTEVIEEAPRSGVWALDESGAAHFLLAQFHRRTVERDNEAFFLRIAGAGDYLYEGADLGILLCPGRLMDDQARLTPRAKEWVAAIRSQYVTRPTDVAAERRLADVGGFKML
ncbi:MAG TPA: biotin carboxylase [Thermoanaerobaculia bacterium]|nr:biotin carboxylase [Thermoanaerobaculia bacterium]